MSIRNLTATLSKDVHNKSIKIEIDGIGIIVYML